MKKNEFRKILHVIICQMVSKKLIGIVNFLFLMFILSINVSYAIEDEKTIIQVAFIGMKQGGVLNDRYNESVLDNHLIKTPTKKSPVKIIFDTDMHTDCDDAGALAVLHVLADNGEVEILSVMCSTKDEYSAATVDAINTYYGRPNIPIGVLKGKGVMKMSKFTQVIANEFPHDFKYDDTTLDATYLYREILEHQPDSSVIIVTVGYLTNIMNLLQLPAENGHLSGMDLVKLKVKKWVCMGGNFIGYPPKDNLDLGNANFLGDKFASYYAIQHWPGKSIFAGREVCSVPSGLAIGENLVKTSVDNPVRRAYQLWFNGELKNRHVADLVTVLYAVRGLRDYWDIETKGYMDVQPNMTFEWKFDKDKNQSYLLKKQQDGVPNDRYIESVLDSLLIQKPKR